MNVSDEILDFLVEQIPAQSLANFRASDAARQRVWTLIAKERESGLYLRRKWSWTITSSSNIWLSWRKRKPWRLDLPDAVSHQSRREVRARAGGRCEYCLILESLLLAGCEADHVASEMPKASKLVAGRLSEATSPVAFGKTNHLGRGGSNGVRFGGMFTAIRSTGISSFAFPSLIPHPSRFNLYEVPHPGRRSLYPSRFPRAAPTPPSLPPPPATR